MLLLLTRLQYTNKLLSEHQTPFQSLMPATKHLIQSVAVKKKISLFHIDLIGL
jgi:hypothetical protein